MFTFSNWSPFIPWHSLGDQHPSIKLASLAVLLYSLFISWTSMLCFGSFSLLISHPMPNSGSKKSLGLYPATSLISARFFPALVKADQTLLWSISFWQWFASLPTTFFRALCILYSQGHPDVCSLLEVSLLISKLQTFLLFLSLPGWVSVVTERQTAFMTLLFPGFNAREWRFLLMILEIFYVEMVFIK